MRKLVMVISGLIVLAGLYVISRYNYLLFHSVAEIFSVVIACGIFMVAWNCRKYLDNHYFLFLGIAYLFIGILDLIHTFTYEGMPLFPGFDANAPTQLWIAARYIESLSLLFAPLMLRRKIREEYYILGYAAVVALLLLSILYWRIFPNCFIADAGGLTPFKKFSEYIISLVLLASGTILFRLRGRFDHKVLLLLETSIGFTVLSELSFTTYASVYGFSNMLGHFFKIVSFYLIYKAIIQTGLTHPYELLFRELYQSKEWLHTTLGSIGDAVIATDTGGHVTFLNPVAEKLTGWPPAEAAGQPVHEIFRIVNEHTRAVVEDPVRRGLQSGMILGLADHTVLIHRDGMEVPIDDSVAPIRDREGTLEGAVLVFRDVTERRLAETRLEESERRYRTLFQSMQPFRLLEPIFDDSGKPRDYRYIEVNEAAARLIGRTTDEMQGRTFRELFPDADPYWIDAMGRVALTGDPVEFEWYSQATGLWYHSYAYRLDDGKVASFMMDITEKKLVEAALKRSNEELEQYAYVASHDLQAPLRSVVGFLQLLQGRYGDKLDKEGLHFIERAVSAGYRMQTLIGDFLTLSRVTTREAVFESCDLNRIVKDTLDNLESILHEKNAAVFCDLLPDLTVDAGQIRSLFQNLISNAVKYNESPNPVIEIGCQENGHAFRFFVKDNGIGIPPEFYQSIFLVFHRLHTEQDYPGTGLGLALCKKIVERHGGRIWVESRPNEGSVFYFTLPQKK